MKVLQRNLNRCTFVVWEMKRNVSVMRFKFRCNILVSGKIIKEMPGSVASGTPYINPYNREWSNTPSRNLLLRMYVRMKVRMYVCMYRVIRNIVGVLTTCHTQYTWGRRTCIFLFNRTTLQVFVTYLTGALYVHPLWFYKHQHDNRVHSKLFVACQWWWFQWRFWFVPSVPGYLREEEEHKPDPWRNPIERNHMGLHLENEVARQVASDHPLQAEKCITTAHRTW